MINSQIVEDVLADTRFSEQNVIGTDSTRIWIWAVGFPLQDVGSHMNSDMIPSLRYTCCTHTD